jgi:hypothetical protein
MVPSMALTTHTQSFDGVDPHGPVPSRDSALDYVQVVDLGGCLMQRRVHGDGLTVSHAPSPATAVAPPADLSWITQPECGGAESMGT